MRQSKPQLFIGLRSKQKHVYHLSYVPLSVVADSANRLNVVKFQGSDLSGCQTSHNTGGVDQFFPRPLRNVVAVCLDTPNESYRTGLKNQPIIIESYTY